MMMSLDRGKIFNGDGGGGGGKYLLAIPYPPPASRSDDDLRFDPTDLAELSVQLEKVEPEPYDQAKVDRIFKKAKITFRDTTADGAGLLPWSCLTAGVGMIIAVLFVNRAGNHYYAYLSTTLLSLIVIAAVVTVAVNHGLPSWSISRRGWLKYFRNFSNARHAVGLGTTFAIVSSMK
jgi:hypothetical protein